jgi:hypothetical protein
MTLLLRRCCVATVRLRTDDGKAGAPSEDGGVSGRDPDGEDDVFRAGFQGPRHIELPPRIVERTAEEVRASVYSLSSAAPHLFGAGFDEFDAGLRTLIEEASPDGRFSERLRGISLSLWR